MRPGPDDTVKLNPRRAAALRRRSRRWSLAGALLLAAGLGAAGTWWSLRPAEAPELRPAVEPVPARRAPAPPPAPAAPAPYAPPLASEGEILADAPERLAIYRFAPQPAVIVLQFPSLGEQARMLNRAAALIEKIGFPHDRILPTPELDARILASGATPETFYYGHDYSSAALLEFFGLAGLSLTDEEARLHSLIGQLGWHPGGPAGAVISLVRQTPDADLDPAGRATILRHELSHGFYFTDPAYAAYVYRFWNETMSAHDRAQFVAFLTREGYDPALQDLMVNETQAYLMYTPDQRFFNAKAVGLSESRIDALRRDFLAGMPPGWLRDVTTVPPTTAPVIIPARGP